MMVQAFRALPCGDVTRLAKREFEFNLTGQGRGRGTADQTARHQGCAGRDAPAVDDLP